MFDTTVGDLIGVLDEGIEELQLAIDDGGVTANTLHQILSELEEARLAVEYVDMDNMDLYNKCAVAEAENETFRDVLDEIRDYFDISWEVRVADTGKAIKERFPR